MLVVKQQGAACREGYRERLSLPNGISTSRENPAWQVTNDKVEASRAMLTHGHEAPEYERPLTHGTVEQNKRTTDVETSPPNPKFTGRRGAAEGGTMG